MLLVCNQNSKGEGWQISITNEIQYYKRVYPMKCNITKEYIQWNVILQIPIDIQSYKTRCLYQWKIILQSLHSISYLFEIK
jgi:hypothetical protein